MIVHAHWHNYLLREALGCYFTLGNNMNGFTNKHKPMNRKITPPRFDHRPHMHILKALVISANLLCLFTYAFLHVIFYDMPFMLQDELIIALYLMGWATGIAVAISFILFVGDALIYFIRHRKQFRFHRIVHVPEPAGQHK